MANICGLVKSTSFSFFPMAFLGTFTHKFSLEICHVHPTEEPKALGRGRDKDQQVDQEEGE